MKKMMCVLLAALLAVALCAAAAADEVPEPGGGKKFASDWAIRGGLVNIVYEEEGYRVRVNVFYSPEVGGTLYEYSCLYREETDDLSAISASKTVYTVDPVSMEITDSAEEYGGLVEEGCDVTFTIAENGKLWWQDDRGNAGADLEFSNIGRFGGSWNNEAADVWVTIEWAGLYNQESYWYNVYIQHGMGEDCVGRNLVGLYNPETGRLQCEDPLTGTRITDGWVIENDTEPYDVYFSINAEGRLVLESGDGLELEYDVMGIQG